MSFNYTPIINTFVFAEVILSFVVRPTYYHLSQSCDIPSSSVASGHTSIIQQGVVGTGHEVTEDYIHVSISLTRAKVTTVKFRIGSPKLEVSRSSNRTLLLKFPDRELTADTVSHRGYSTDHLWVS